MAVRSPAINVMVTAATKVARALNRDFGEIEQLQTSIANSPSLQGEVLKL